MFLGLLFAPPVLCRDRGFSSVTANEADFDFDFDFEPNLRMPESTNTLAAPDLTQRPPRSSRQQLGGFVTLPRLLDKCRAEIAGTAGEYHYNCPLDQHFLNFMGVDPAALKTEVASGKGDGELLLWIQQNSKTPRQPWEIKQWSEYMLQRTPDSDAETLSYFVEAVGKFTTVREDIRTWADLLDLDDYCSFGGRA